MSITKMQKRRRLLRLYIAAAVIAAALLAAILCICRKPAPEPEVLGPHAEQVLVNDGANEIWITPAEGIEPSGFTADDFRTQNGLPCYIGKDYRTLQGIDICEFQSPVDWERVKADGIDFAIIRCGGRRYGESGLLYRDDAFVENISGAQRVGIQVGAYFFSQAVTPEEAKEEAKAALAVLDGCDIDLPVFFDWERPADETARTQMVELSALTEMARAFCDTVRQGGYTPGVYFNRQLGYYAYDWAQLSDCTRWVADPGDWPDFYYAPDFWQYSFDSEVDGINIQTDRNLMFVKK